MSGREALTAESAALLGEMLADGWDEGLTIPMLAAIEAAAAREALEGFEDDVLELAEALCASALAQGHDPAQVAFLRGRIHEKRRLRAARASDGGR